MDTDSLSIETDRIISDTDANISDTDAIIIDTGGLSVETDANIGVQQLLALFRNLYLQRFGQILLPTVSLFDFIYESETIFLVLRKFVCRRQKPYNSRE